MNHNADARRVAAEVALSIKEVSMVAVMLAEGDSEGAAQTAGAVLVPGAVLAYTLEALFENYDVETVRKSAADLGIDLTKYLTEQEEAV